MFRRDEYRPGFSVSRVRNWLVVAIGVVVIARLVGALAEPILMVLLTFLFLVLIFQYMYRRFIRW